MAIAEQVATLDVMSGGRVIFGVGIGYRDDGFVGFDVNPNQRYPRRLGQRHIPLRGHALLHP